jgi:hypothetical protein
MAGAERKGQTQVTIRADESLIELLIDQDLLQRNQSEDRAAVQTAIEDLLKNIKDFVEQSP